MASGCNVVFHRACLAASGKTCPKCNEEHDAKSTLALFGANFGGRSLDIAAAASRSAEGGTSVDEEEDAVARVAAFRSAAKLMERRQELQELQASLKEKLEVLAGARKTNDRSEEKVTEMQKAARKQDRELAELQKKREEEEVKYQKCIEGLNLMRVRGTAFEYWEKIKANQEGEALKFLNTMVGVGGHSWRILTEVNRLQAHMKKQLERERKEAAAASAKLQVARHQLEDLVMEHRSKQIGSRTPGGPPVKRLRSALSM